MCLGQILHHTPWASVDLGLYEGSGHLAMSVLAHFSVVLLANGRCILVVLPYPLWRLWGALGSNTLRLGRHINGDGDCRCQCRDDKMCEDEELE
jgi:hypothetical protein